MVFFNGILIYNPSWEDHLQHLQQVLHLMQNNTLHANLKKCAFGVEKIHHLGHINSHKGVQTELDKIQAVVGWPIPKNLKQFKGFLGLTGYYRRFIHDYGKICRPLTSLLKKGAFHLSLEATEAFNILRQKVTSSSVLALPDFKKNFLIEADASGKGMGEILMQEAHLIAYESKAFFIEKTCPFLPMKENLWPLFL